MRPVSWDECHLQAQCTGAGDEHRTAVIGVIAIVHPRLGWFAFAGELGFVDAPGYAQVDLRQDPSPELTTERDGSRHAACRDGTLPHSGSVLQRDSVRAWSSLHQWRHGAWRAGR